MKTTTKDKIITVVLWAVCIYVSIASILGFMNGINAMTNCQGPDYDHRTGKMWQANVWTLGTTGTCLGPE